MFTALDASIEDYRPTFLRDRQDDPRDNAWNMALQFCFEIWMENKLDSPES